MKTDELVFVGFNSRVAALDRRNGEIVWSWKAPKGSGYVTLLLDRDLVLVSVNGYQYGLEAASGEEIWFNPMTGFGFGVAAIASGSASAGQTVTQAAAVNAQTAAQSGGAAT